MATIKSFINEAVSQLEEGNLAVFIGAGISAPAGFVNWKELLRPLAEDIDLDINKEHDLVTLAQYHVTKHNNNRADLNQAILDNFSKRDAKHTENHEILARLPISTFWTTNYDTLIEDALRAAGKIADIKHSVKQIPATTKGRDAVVYKMHGDVNHAQDAVLCRDDYERYHRKNSPFITALSGELVSKTFIFLGFSFSDPNLDYILSRLRLDHEENQRKHFCILKAESKLPGDSDVQLEYRKTKQSLFINDLQARYNIRAVLVENYQQITDLLKTIESRHKRKTVFISGAAHDYSFYGSEADSLKLVQSIAQKLIRSNHKIVSGLGLGIGSSVIDGALQEIYYVKKRTLKDELIIRPFPQTYDALWSQYRDDMLSYAGIAMFMFGNKLKDGTLQLSNGMREEFNIAVSKGIKVLPLGFTGHVAKELWELVKSDFDSYYPSATQAFIGAFNELGKEKTTNDEILINIEIALNELGNM
jgi:NAD-dependent SIR2 family protein deacetylase